MKLEYAENILSRGEDKRKGRDCKAIRFVKTALFKILSDRKMAPDHKLPSTGVELEWERLLSSIFIESPGYGTRSSSVLLIGKNKRVKWVEKVFDGKPEPWIESRFSFLLNRAKSI